MLRLLTALALVCVPATALAGRTIAIAYFDNNTGSAELDPLRKGLADMLITDLGAVSSLQIVERDKLNQVLDELKLGRSKFIDPRTAQKLGKGLAAEYIMTGSYALARDVLALGFDPATSAMTIVVAGQFGFVGPQHGQREGAQVDARGGAAFPLHWRSRSTQPPVPR